MPKKIPTVVIEIGGDHGDGNVEVIKKPKGIKLVIKDWDNADLPEDADEQDAPVPQERWFNENEEIENPSNED